MTEALIMEDIAGRTHQQIIVWAQMAILRAFEPEPDSTLSDKSKWAVVPLGQDFYGAVSFDIFKGNRNTQQKETS
jgi:hypothetical protein